MIVIRDRLDRLEPIVVQSFTGVRVLQYAGKYSKQAPDPEGQYKAAHDFLEHYLARVFFPK